MTINKILLVDDDALVATFMINVLNLLGYHAVLAGSGDVALGLLRTNPDEFKCIITDYMMPSMNGIQLITKIRHDEGMTDIPIILNTGYGISEHFNKLKELNVIHLPKPNSLMEIKRVVCETIDGVMS